MKEVTIEELLKDGFFQEKLKEVKTDEEMSALLGSYRIIAEKNEVSSESGTSSEAAKMLAGMFASAGFEVPASAVQEAINSSTEIELDEADLEEVAGGKIGPRRFCRRVCIGFGLWRFCYNMCY